jgi:response regulator RpfG family c-di-GMP phosphodiesterase
MGLTEDYIQSIETAALLHNIGKIGLPDRLLDQPYFDLPYADRAEFDKHPLRSAAALMALEPLVQAAELIRHHLDHYDGMGNRSGLRGEGIPLGARILLVASDYDALQEGLLGHERMSADEAQEMIDKGSGMRYDPAVVDAFRRVAGSFGQYGRAEAEFQVTSNQLHEGMLLTHDVITGDGMLLLLKDTVLNSGHIREIKEFEASAGEPLAIFTHSI